MLGQVEGLSKRECEKKIFKLTGKVITVHESKKRIDEDKMKVAIVLSDETIALMEKLKGLMNGEKNSDTLIQFAVNSAIEKIEKQKFKQTTKRSSPPPADVGRYVSSQIKRETYLRDKKCTQCGSVTRLQFDHRKPFALGGLSTIDNIRLLCFQCNQRARMRSGLSHPFRRKGPD